MKTLKKLILTLFVSTMIFSCIDDDNDELTGNAALGGLVDVGNPLISYVVGSGNTYSAAGAVFQANIQTTEVKVYNTFTDNMSGSSSNRVLLKTIPISNTAVGTTANFTVTFTYEELIAGLTLNGSPLPDSDGGLNIGDFWTLEYEAVTSEGKTHNNSSVTKVAVGTRYAGIYTVVASAYWNSGSLLGNWTGGDRVIESVDATIYRHAGLAYWDDNEFFFTVDNDTNVITVLDKDLEDGDLLLNGSPVMTCTGGTGSFEVLTCDGTTSRAIPDDVTGKDVLEFTVGYFRGVGATREFFERLEKQVD
ncbi:hypothetical protein [Algibacter luteus]|uniref:Uncharacterized protein n=1 Tax=Algibacter luteus TaxID=1178825 RepID=A0A1M6AFH2_9FLAO|nr:hypothetical protein [Algibacter luteus]SHI35209.1 hypothetical protein SAMN05216261_0397 [Algibacter luteus]